VYAGGERFEVTGAGYTPSGQFVRKGIAVDVFEFPALTECLKAGLLCNDSMLSEKEGRWTIQGDPTEGSLFVSAAKAGLNAADMNTALPRIDVIPFESQHQYMATLHSGGKERTNILYVKGSVETVLRMCALTLDSDGQPAALDAEAIDSAAGDMATRGIRILAFARGEREKEATGLEHSDVISGLIFLGLQGMIDPPRQEAILAVEKCHTAGILVKMITGDHALTASSIARHVGLQNPSAVITGGALTEISDRELIDVADRTSVFARVTPEQKLRLVEALQVKGNVVAMTGDGVNDAPALKRADIGVAMGITGTDVAKEAADMVLTDDNFASIEAAVEEGRGIFDNLTKFIVWTLPTNLGEGLVILAAIFAGVTLPILPVQILWINMTTAILLGLMLAFEPKEPGIMSRQPRDPKTPILTGILMWRLILVGVLLLVGAFGLFEWELMLGANIAEARTVAVNVFVMVQLFYLFNCRSLTQSVFSLGFFSNPSLFGGAVVMLIFQMMFTYLPAMNFMFHSAPIGFGAWGRIVVVAIIISFTVGVEKWFRKKIMQRRSIALSGL
jgi:Ca2+-transporting ATPase